jgi:hypothetical protein
LWDSLFKAGWRGWGFPKKKRIKVEIGKKNLIRKIIGALVNAFFLPGLGQVIAGRVKKGVGIIGTLIFLMFFMLGGGVLSSSVIVALVCFFGIIVVYLYALVDVIIGEVK